MLEEPSARDLLEGLLPQLIPEALAKLDIRFIVFEGKQDLEKRMPIRMQAWRAPDSHFVVLRDQDSADCEEVKQHLVELAQTAGRGDALIRVACRELESWVVGDWTALAEAFAMPALARQANKRKFRDPDALHSPVTELRRHIAEYQKRDGARRVGPLLDPERNSSTSFRVFCSGLKALALRILASEADKESEGS